MEWAEEIEDWPSDTPEIRRIKAIIRVDGVVGHLLDPLVLNGDLQRFSVGEAAGRAVHTETLEWVWRHAGTEERESWFGHLLGIVVSCPSTPRKRRLLDWLGEKRPDVTSWRNPRIWYIFSEPDGLRWLAARADLQTLAMCNINSAAHTCNTGAWLESVKYLRGLGLNLELDKELLREAVANNRANVVDLLVGEHGADGVRILFLTSNAMRSIKKLSKRMAVLLRRARLTRTSRENNGAVLFDCAAL